MANTRPINMQRGAAIRQGMHNEKDGFMGLSSLMKLGLSREESLAILRNGGGDSEHGIKVDLAIEIFNKALNNGAITLNGKGEVAGDAFNAKNQYINSDGNDFDSPLPGPAEKPPGATGKGRDITKEFYGSEYGNNGRRTYHEENVKVDGSGVHLTFTKGSAAEARINQDMSGVSAIGWVEKRGSTSAGNHSNMFFYSKTGDKREIDFAERLDGAPTLGIYNAKGKKVKEVKYDAKKVGLDSWKDPRAQNVEWKVTLDEKGFTVWAKNVETGEWVPMATDNSGALTSKNAGDYDLMCSAWLQDWNEGSFAGFTGTTNTYSNITVEKK